MKMATETIYGTNEESHVMSEKVQSLAATVYKEFEKVIKKYDEDVVKDLMPLVVGILETLDATFTEKQELDVEIELLREDNEQLLTQYEREKQLRKGAEQKFLEMEDTIEGIKKELEDKVETLESILRMSEIKAKNSADHVSRLEEKEQETKNEYNKLHERYTELFRTHMDYMERTKILMGTDKLSDLTGMSPRITKGGFHLPGLRPVSMAYGGLIEFQNRHENSPMHYETGTPQNIVSLKSELDAQTPKKVEATDKEQLTESADITEQASVTKEPNRQLSLATKRSEQVFESQGSGSREVHISVIDAEMTSQPLEARNVNQPVYIEESSSEIQRTHLMKQSICTLEPSSENYLTSTQHLINQTSDALETRTTLQTIHSLDSNVLVEQPPVILRTKSKKPGEISRFEKYMSYDGDHVPVSSTPELEEARDDSEAYQGLLNKHKSVRNDNSIFDELTVQDADIAEVDFGADITDSSDEHEEHEEEKEDEENEENDKDSVGDNFFGMGKELDNLIQENSELLATKNALNIVKDDLIAKVDELSSEQEILREEITSLQAVKGRLQLRITQLEEELKKVREEQDKKEHEQNEKGEEEDDLPMAQRKRFTRVEMARVLMERNQYKESLMELQEAIRWTEMVRASKEHPAELPPKKKTSVWNLFSKLFQSSNPKRPLPVATVKYNAPTTHVQPVGDPNKKSRDKGSVNPKSKAYDFLQDDVKSEKAKKEREKERREQYKQVRAHVKKDDGRMQAYGWSLPTKFTTHVSKDIPGKSQVPVPVPVYCRPLFENQTEWKIWCAAGVNLTGGKTRDGGSIVGASVFYSDPPPAEKKETAPKNEVEKLENELRDHNKNIKDAETEHMSSLIWVCTSTHEASRVSVIDANNPGDVLETFRVSVSHILCIASIPGAMESDYPVAEEILNAEAPTMPKETVVTAGSSPGSGGESTGLGGVSFVQCATGGTSPVSASPVGSLTDTRSDDVSIKVETSGEGEENVGEGVDPLGAAGSSDTLQTTQVFRAKGSPASSGSGTPTHSARLRVSGSATDLITDGRASPTSENEWQTEAEKMSSVLPTMWMGTQSGSMYVHSSVSNWKRCLHSVKLRDSVVGIVHVKGRVLVSLADGTVAIFHRAADGQWDLLNYHLIDLGKPKHSIRCITVVAGKYVWCGYKNKIHIIDPEKMSIEKSFDAHPRKESQVKQLCWVGDGVWLSIRLDSTLRLYHAYTHQHLQDVDIEPYVSKMLGTGRLGFSFVRITAMLISCNRLWIGTGNGVIISVPLSENNKQPMITTSASLSGRPGGAIRVYSDPNTESVTPGSFIPYCSMAQAQLSFHGHKDAVKFFVSVPALEESENTKYISHIGSWPSEHIFTRHRKDIDFEEGIQRQGLSAASDLLPSSSTPPPKGEALPAPPTNTQLILSGGEGYVDFRLGEGDDEEVTSAPSIMDGDDDTSKASSLTKVDRSHLIVWQDVTTKY
ncbi:C-Jun-amino-terminal kinase-interacting protein 3-like isoform X3 [Biomphalaria glabrata]|uniref:C-Jun-amino-terminal kinase-interacting protein 3-like isoform X3 n=1 Tax=Biomphalaria glabrata TaxID=6526 RepID=A0A9W3B1J4_BIOGL|nr:C-Jun-amino-terminal kinase-interacting protein 3-like isoform X3 [Biomphalaria glabrata]